MGYTININSVVDAFLNLAGKEALSEGRVFCNTSTETIASWLDNKKDLSANDLSICYAAACMAFYRYTLKNEKAAQSVRAGDITVTDMSDKIVEYSKGLMEDALKAIEHLLKPKRFAFIRTEGEE